MGRRLAVCALAAMLAAARPGRAEEDDAPLAPPLAPPPPLLWYGILQPSYWLGGTDAEGEPGQHGTGEAMIRLELGIQLEPPECGTTFAIGIPASLRLSFIGTEDLDSPLGTFRLGLGAAVGHRIRRGGDFPQAWDIQLIASSTLDEGERQPGASLAFRLRGESGFVAVEATAVREAYGDLEWDRGLMVGFGLPRASGNRTGLVMLGIAALAGVAVVVLLSAAAPST